ncbi:aldehyde dehydrogenase family protein [Mycoplasma crocodyli]|nr:aldehyde dehydrogenase family protein [Mycoplasma crocodyli]
MNKLELLNTKPSNFLNNKRKRKEILKDIYNWIKVNNNKIEEALYKDLGKHQIESYLSEIQIVLKEIRMLINKIGWTTKKHRVGNNISNPLTYFDSSFYKFEPLGTIFIIAPFNYPFHLAIMPLVGAIASGNKVILKPSDKCSHVANVIKDLIYQTKLHKVAEYLEHDSLVEEINQIIDSKPNLIFFTGSTKVGKIIDLRAKQNGINTIMELGSPCPVYVDKRTNVKVIAKRLIWAKSYNAGQTCVSPNHVFVHKDIYQSFINELNNQAIKQLGINSESNWQLAKIINRETLQYIKDKFEKLTKNNLVVDEEQNKIQLKIFEANLEEHQEFLRWELFSPILPVFKVENSDQAISLFNKYNNDALSAYICTTDKKVIDNFIEKTNSGSLSINDMLIHISNSRLPFGGINNSGHGRYRYKESIRAFSKIRSYYKSNNSLDFSSRFLPYSQKKYKFIKRFIK